MAAEDHEAGNGDGEEGEDFDGADGVGEVAREPGVEGYDWRPFEAFITPRWPSRGRPHSCLSHLSRWCWFVTSTVTCCPARRSGRVASYPRNGFPRFCHTILPQNKKILNVGVFFKTSGIHILIGVLNVR